MATEQVCDRCDGTSAVAQFAMPWAQIDLCAICATGVQGWFDDGKRQQRLRGSQAPR
jgi:hypothetical protein